jgi:NitT/TauT family transport system ATP-binding protein
MSQIELSHISQSFHVDGSIIKAIDDVTFAVDNDEFVCIVGPSGSGKSTLLRVLLGLVKPTAGTVRLAGNPTIGMVFQSFALFPWLTVADNIGFGLKMQGRPQRDIDRTVKELVDMMGLAGAERKHPRELSGGMKQRVGIARALAVEPDILLMDEPFSALDAFTATQLRQDMLQIWGQRKMTVVMVTHLVDEAVQLADRVLVMSAGPGRLIAEVPIKLARPRQQRTKGFYADYDRISQLITAEM